MGRFSRTNKPPIERILDEAMPMVLGMQHTNERTVLTVPYGEEEARQRLEAHISQDGVLLDPAALEQNCALAALLTGTVAAIPPAILCMDFAPAEGGGTAISVCVHCKKGLLVRDTGKRVLAGLERALQGKEG